MELFEFYNFKFTLTNVIDVLLVAGIVHQLYRLLKGSLAFNMLIGLITIYVFWMVIRYLNMPLMEVILGEITKFGFLAIIILFQQEIRKFLLLLGKVSFLAEGKSVFRFLPWNWKIEKSAPLNFEEILEAAQFLADTNQGALMVFPKTSEMKFIGSSGEALDSNITKRMLISLFNKYSPLHDGAVIIANGKIKAANAILPVSENPEHLQKFGLRHLSALGITEQTDAIALVVSEEKGTIALAKGGKMLDSMNKHEMIELLNKEFLDETSNTNG